MTTSLMPYVPEDEVIVSITNYLDSILSKTYHRAAGLLTAIDSLDDIYNILDELNNEVMSDFTSAQRILVYNMNLRLNDASEILQSKWSNPVLLENSTKALQALYLRFVDNDPQVFDTSPLVHYSTTGHWKVQAVRGYITPRVIVEPNYRNRYTSTLLCCPLWVYNTMALLSGDDFRGQAFREFYSKKDASKGYTQHSPMSSGTYGCSVGAPVYGLTGETLSSALVFWDPGDKKSVYHDFDCAAFAARLLG